MKVNGKCVMPTCGRFHLQGCGPCRRILFLLRLSRKRESGCCLHLPAATFRPLWIVKSREILFLIGLSKKGLFWLIWLKRHGGSQRLSDHVIQTLSLSPWLCLSDYALRLHVVAFRAAVVSTLPRCTAWVLFLSFLEKSWTSCWLTWLRSWDYPESRSLFRNISSSPCPNLEEWGPSPEHGEAGCM